MLSGSIERIKINTEWPMHGKLSIQKMPKVSMSAIVKIMLYQFFGDWLVEVN